MRNLKKVLSLVLALAMVLSICMVGAGAVNYDDFTDEESITKKQAVETLVSLDVIKGYNDGATFNPTGNVTRAEMATMICRVLAGGDNMIPDAVKPVPTYTDVRSNPSAAWAETYIEYCTSLGIVSGKGNGIFDPMADVTAAEAAKMVMTALGYNADIEGFKGIGWDINTMAKASTLKLTDKLVGEISANQPMTREQVAQLLFNALDKPMVQYYEGSNANVWIGAGNVNDKYYETLLEAKFHAQKLTGVVIANEWADLYAKDPLGKGKTRVLALGTDNMPTKQEYTLNLTTSLEQIGESIIVYRDTTSNRILFGNDQATNLNMVNEFTAKGDITDSKDFENAIDKNALTKDTQYFVNYDIGSVTSCDYKIKYVVEFELKADADALQKENATVNADDHQVVKSDDGKNYVYERTIPKNTQFTAVDLHEIENIFSRADRKGDEQKSSYVDGEVYVGTQSTKDISDTMSWKEFDAEYLETNNEQARDTKNVNGNYIKTVDYNNDGEIDFVLKTIYSVTNVKSVKDDKVDLYLDDVNDAVNAKKLVDSVYAYDELAKDDIVVYAVIDGIAHTYLADMKTAKIDKVNRNNLTATTTDGDEYTQSGVNEWIDEDLEFEAGVRQLAGSTSYDLYFDRYGYLAAFTQTATAGNFTLLVDAWYNVQRGGTEYAVLAWNEGKLVDTDVSRNGDLFIGNDDSLNNSWNQLKYFGGSTGKALNGDDLHIQTGNKAMRTTVVSMSEDNILSPVDQVYNKKTIRMIATENNVIPKQAYVAGASYETSKDAKTAYNTLDEANVEVRALSSTVYYYVYGTGKNAIVKEYVGYANAPAVKADEVEDVYVVGTQARRSSGLSDNKTYYTANVVVVELQSKYRANVEQVFVYDLPEVGSNVTIENVDIIRGDGTKANVQIDFKNSKVNDGVYLPANDKGRANFGLYFMWESNTEGVYTIEPMSPTDIANNNYTVGQIVTTDYTTEEDWFEVLAYTWDGDAKQNSVLSDVAGKTDTQWRAEGNTKENPDTPQYTVTDKSGIWTLSYEGTGNSRVASMRDGAAKDVLAERVNESKDARDAGNRDASGYDDRNNNGRQDANEPTIYFDRNDVLVRYDNRGNVVYAISFANDAKPDSSVGYTWNAAGRTGNWAQYVWDFVKPAQKQVSGTAAPASVILYDRTAPQTLGVTLRDKTYNAPANNYVNNIAWADWKDAKDEAAYIEIYPAKDNEIIVSDHDYVTRTDVDGKDYLRVELTEKVGSSTPEPITVMSRGDGAKAWTEYEYTINYVAVKSAAKLIVVAPGTNDLSVTATPSGTSTVLEANQYIQTNASADIADFTGKTWTVEDFLKFFALDTGSENATVNWTFNTIADEFYATGVGANAKVYGNTNRAQMNAVLRVTAVVTSEDGATTTVYTNGAAGRFKELTVPADIDVYVKSANDTWTKVLPTSGKVKLPEGTQVKFVYTGEGTGVVKAGAATVPASGIWTVGNTNVAITFAAATVTASVDKEAGHANIAQITSVMPATATTTSTATAAKITGITVNEGYKLELTAKSGNTQPDGSGVNWTATVAQEKNGTWTVSVTFASIVDGETADVKVYAVEDASAKYTITLDTSAASINIDRVEDDAVLVEKDGTAKFTITVASGHIPVIANGKASLRSLGTVENGKTQWEVIVADVASSATIELDTVEGTILAVTDTMVNKGLANSVKFDAASFNKIRAHGVSLIETKAPTTDNGVTTYYVTLAVEDENALRDSVIPFDDISAEQARGICLWYHGKNNATWGEAMTHNDDEWITEAKRVIKVIDDVNKGNLFVYIPVGDDILLHHMMDGHTMTYTNFANEDETVQVELTVTDVRTILNDVVGG